MNILKPKYTSIRRIVELEDGYLILEEDQNLPKGKSNLYKTDREFKTIWEVPLMGYLCFDYLTVKEDSKIVIGMYPDGEAILDLESGTVKDIHFVK